MTSAHDFWLAASRQRACAACSSTGTFDAHHCVYEQHLRREHLPLFEPANALRLCKSCHAAHHARRDVVRTSRLRDENLVYVLTALGELRGFEYLRRYYDDAEHDERLTGLR